MNPMPFSAAERAQGVDVQYYRTHGFSSGAITGDVLPAEAPAAPMRITRWSASNQPTRESAWLIPTLIALTVALAVAILALVAAVRYGWDLLVPFGVFGITFLGVLLWRLDVADDLVRVVEEVSQRDVNGDGQIGAVRPGTTTIYRPPALTPAIDRSLARQAELMTFVAKCLTDGTSERAHGIKSPAAVAEHNARRADLMRIGVAAWKNPKRATDGWQIVVSEDEARRLIAAHI